MRRTADTTNQLKEAMGTALLELMVHKPLEKISIEEMTARANVGRSTYFRYFKSKDEVLAFKFRREWERAERSYKAAANENPAASLERFFTFLLGERKTIDLMYQAGHSRVILLAYLDTFGPQVDAGDVDGWYRTNCIAYMIFGLINAWILRGYKETPAQMTDFMLNRLSDVPQGVAVK